jgi:hypothetical protein
MYALPSLRHFFKTHFIFSSLTISLVDMFLGLQCFITHRVYRFFALVYRFFREGVLYFPLVALHPFGIVQIQPIPMR